MHAEFVDFMANGARRIRDICAAALLGSAMLVALALPAGAADITRTYNFSASGFGVGAPVDPVIGSVTVTFDPTLTYAGGGTTIGITLNSLNITLGSAIGFIYFPGSYLEFGGMNANVEGIGAGTDDFSLFVNDPANNPTFGPLGYTQIGSDAAYITSLVVSTDVPEPASAALLISGLLGLMVRRVRRAARAI